MITHRPRPGSDLYPVDLSINKETVFDYPPCPVLGRCTTEVPGEGATWDGVPFRLCLLWVKRKGKGLSYDSKESSHWELKLWDPREVSRNPTHGKYQSRSVSKDRDYHRKGVRLV